MTGKPGLKRNDPSDTAVLDFRGLARSFPAFLSPVTDTVALDDAASEVPLTVTGGVVEMRLEVGSVCLALRFFVGLAGSDVLPVGSDVRRDDVAAKEEDEAGTGINGKRARMAWWYAKRSASDRVMTGRRLGGAPCWTIGGLSIVERVYWSARIPKSSEE